MEKDWLVMMSDQHQLAQLIGTNKDTEQFGLTLDQKDAELILAERRNALKEQKRVEFGESIAPKIIREFCDSAYITQNNYTAVIIHLQEIFYLYKNEMQDEITDDELLHLMKEQFEKLCFGDLEYLEGTCLANFAQAVRAGYGDFHATDGYGVYDQFDEVPRWDYDLYLQTLKELCWD